MTKEEKYAFLVGATLAEASQKTKQFNIEKLLDFLIITWCMQDPTISEKETIHVLENFFASAEWETFTMKIGQ